jgi:sialate O-acetylesterase
MRAIVLCSIFFCFLTGHTNAQLKPAQVFGHHMVLQRNKPLPIWGWAAKNESVKVSLNGTTIKATANAEGKWLVTLPSMKEGGPYELRVAGKKESISYNDIMIGEVWICSGQSNMEWVLKDAEGFKEAQREASLYPIRHFAVSKEAALSPIKDLPKGEWATATPSTIGDFTAVGYFFAKELSQKLHVTVGLINSSWGGSQIEGWISKEAMQSSDIFKEYANNIPTTWQEADDRKDKQLKQFVRIDDETRLLEPIDLAKKGIEFFDNWNVGFAPGSWDWLGKYESYRGKGFMQKTIFMDEIDVSKKSFLRLADKDGDIEIFVNGNLVKALDLVGKPEIELSLGTWRSGANNLLLHFTSQKEPTWFGTGIYGEKQNLYLRFDDANINLSGNDWRLMPDFKSDYRYEKTNNRVGTTLFNAMIRPLIPFAMQGVIWYQGESNAGRSFQYRTAFPLLINDWRKQWKSDFPFLFVQLASFGEQPTSNKGSGLAELREAQAMALALPNTGMAVTTDIGDPNDVHPRNKSDVGKRLAANALNKVYGFGIVFCGPTYKSVEFTNHKAIVSFTNVHSGLLIKDKHGYLKAFEIAGADKKFYFAKATMEGDKVIVWCDDVLEPVAVRYGWTDAAVDANLFNKDGFPAPPFRTDDWKCVTEGVGFE